MKNKKKIVILMFSLISYLQIRALEKMSKFENLRSLTDLTEAEIAHLKEHCFARMVEVGTHLLYMGRDSNNYSQTTFDFRGIRYHMYRHQLSLYLKKYDDPTFDMASWDNSLTTSHLCHKKRCVNPAHLELESMDTNKERENCFAQNVCHHHDAAPDCLI